MSTDSIWILLSRFLCFHLSLEYLLFKIPDYAVSAFTTPTPHPNPIQPFRPTLPVSSYRIYSLNYTTHVIICETYLYAMYRSHKRAIASESNDPLGFTRVIFYTHNIAGVPILEPPSPQSTRSRSEFFLVYSLFDSIHSILRLFFFYYVFLNKVVNHTWVCERTVYFPLQYVVKFLSNSSPLKHSLFFSTFLKFYLEPCTHWIHSSTKTLSFLLLSGCPIYI